jgi:hypothetical protein
MSAVVEIRTSYQTLTNEVFLNKEIFQKIFITIFDYVNCKST